MATTLELEASDDQALPLEFYHFYRGSEDWYYVTAERVKSLDGIQHLPLELTRGQIDVGGEDRPGALSITLPTDSVLGLIFQEGSAPSPINLAITRQLQGATDDPWIIFIGEVTSADVEGETVTIQVLPFTARLDVIVPQGLYQKDQCQWNTYDPFTCKVDKATFTFTGTVAAVSGLSVEITGASAFNPGTGARDDMFVGGILEKGERKGMIESQNGDVVILLESVPTLDVGDVVSLVAGDNRRLETCRDKFNKANRRLAFPHLPVLNPFYGQGLRP